jgi:adenylate cyclase
MGIEIERKFLVVGNRWHDAAAGVQYRQGYLSTRKDVTVRVRTMGDRAALTIKGRTVGATRPEFEYEIPMEDCRQLFALSQQPLIEKTRYTVEYDGLLWEVDKFHGANEGLIVAECELQSEDQLINKPDWVGDEVTYDPRYYNSNLIAQPFSTW